MIQLPLLIIMQLCFGIIFLVFGISHLRYAHRVKTNTNRLDDPPYMARKYLEGLKYAMRKNLMEPSDPEWDDLLDRREKQINASYGPSGWLMIFVAIVNLLMFFLKPL